MEEILTSGKVEHEFERLGIDAKRTYGNDDTLYSVYQLSDEDYEILDQDSRVNNPAQWTKGGWRWSMGSIKGDPDTFMTVNGHKLLCWSGTDITEDYGYGDLLSYLSNVQGCSAFRNVCSLTIDLAKHNRMSLGELFTKYQGYREDEHEGIIKEVRK